MLSRDREEYIRNREEFDRIDAENAVDADDVPEDAEDQEHQKRVQKKTGTRSVVSTSTSIPMEEIKRRVALEAFRKKEKVRLTRFPHYFVFSDQAEGERKTVGSASWSEGEHEHYQRVRRLDLSFSTTFPLLLVFVAPG